MFSISIYFFQIIFMCGLIDEEEYHIGVEELKYSAIGKLTLSHWEEVPTTMEIRRMLTEFWKIYDLKIIALGRGTFHIILSNLKNQCSALLAGSLLLKPSILRLNRRVPSFNALKHESISQVWFVFIIFRLDSKKLKTFSI